MSRAIISSKCAHARNSALIDARTWSFTMNYGFLGAKNLYCHVFYVWEIVYFSYVQFKCISNQCGGGPAGHSSESAVRSEYIPNSVKWDILQKVQYNLSYKTT